MKHETTFLKCKTRNKEIIDIFLRNCFQSLLKNRNLRRNDQQETPDLGENSLMTCPAHCSFLDMRSQNFGRLFQIVDMLSRSGDVDTEIVTILL